MTWTRHADRNEFFLQLFPDSPSLRDVRVLELGLHEDGPALSMTVNLNDFPTSPPAKWKEQSANRVQVRLVFFAMTSVQLTGWGTNNVCDIEIEKRDGRIRVNAAGGAWKLTAESEHLRLDRVSGYWDESIPKR
jgi:hypothetical protein